MFRRNTALASNQILLFPQEAERAEIVAGVPKTKESEPKETASARGNSVVLCGSYRKDPEGLQRIFERLKDEGFLVLSPSNALIESEEQGFVYMRHEGAQTPDQLENRHLDAIQKADFVWFFAPNGYVGPTGALEVGFARANGIPVYSDTPLNDTAIKQFVEIVKSPATVQDYFRKSKVRPPRPAINSFQHYYRRVALQRGYSKENAKDCLLLMVEEVGELARALRKRAHMIRHGQDITNQEAHELADVFIYVVHMANILKIDLSEIVQEKEMINIKKLIDGK
jgi:NTP pyrophosphatase (non-canonical NTP hydrolase)